MGSLSSRDLAICSAAATLAWSAGTGRESARRMWAARERERSRRDTVSA